MRLFHYGFCQRVFTDSPWPVTGFVASTSTPGNQSA